MESMRVRAAAAGDARAIAGIYNRYVHRTVITFEEQPVAPAEIARRMEQVQSASLPWLVAEDGSGLAGYAYATPWKSRSAYRFSVESTVYVAPECSGRGIGSLLYAELIPILQTRQIHAVMGGIALPNPASIALHEKFGFRKVAEFREVGFKFDRWVDVGYWQRILD